MHKVVIKRYGDKICADPVEQPGSPIIGRGDTPYEALVELLRLNDAFRIEVIDMSGFVSLEVKDKNTEENS